MMLSVCECENWYLLRIYLSGSSRVPVLVYIMRTNCYDTRLWTIRYLSFDNVLSHQPYEAVLPVVLFFKHRGTMRTCRPNANRPKFGSEYPSLMSDTSLPPPLLVLVLVQRTTGTSTEQSKLQTIDPIRFHYYDVSIHVTVIIYSESSCRRILKLTSFGAFPNTHAKLFSCQIGNCYLSPSISDSCDSLQNHSCLQYLSTSGLHISLKASTNVLQILIFNQASYYKYLYYLTKRAIWCANFVLKKAQQDKKPYYSMHGTFQCTNFNLQIGFIGQVIVLLYARDYLVYKF